MTGLVSSIIQESLTVTFGLDIKPSHFKNRPTKRNDIYEMAEEKKKEDQTLTVEQWQQSPATLDTPLKHSRVMWCSIKRSSFQLNHMVFFFVRSSSSLPPYVCVSCALLTIRSEWMGRDSVHRRVFKCTNMYRLSATLWQINRITANDTCWIYEVPFSLWNATSYLSYVPTCQIYTHIYYTLVDHPHSCFIANGTQTNSVLGSEGYWVSTWNQLKLNYLL